MATYADDNTIFSTRNDHVETIHLTSDHSIGKLCLKICF